MLCASEKHILTLLAGTKNENIHLALSDCEVATEHNHSSSLMFLFHLNKIITEFRSEGASGAHPAQTLSEAGSASRQNRGLCPPGT